MLSWPGGSITSSATVSRAVAARSVVPVLVGSISISIRSPRPTTLPLPDSSGMTSTRPRGSQWISASEKPSRVLRLRKKVASVTR